MLWFLSAFPQTMIGILINSGLFAVAKMAKMWWLACTLRLYGKVVVMKRMLTSIWACAMNYAQWNVSRQFINRKSFQSCLKKNIHLDNKRQSFICVKWAGVIGETDQLIFHEYLLFASKWNWKFIMFTLCFELLNRTRHCTSIIHAGRNFTSATSAYDNIISQRKANRPTPVKCHPLSKMENWITAPTAAV